MKQRTDIAFPMSEYERRLALVRAGMQRRELDALLVTTPENITYLTGFESPGHYWFQALVVPAQGEPFTVSRLLETSGVDAYSWIEHNLAYSDDDDQMAVLAARLTDFDLAGATVGFEKECWFFTAAQQEQLFANLPGARFVDASGTVEACRLIKSELEVDMIRQAARTTEAGMRAGIAAVIEGATENDVAADISYAMIKAGSEWPSIVPFVASGERGAIGHATWRERVLQSGDTVFLEVAGCRRRYHAPMMRTCVVGSPAPELEAAFQVVIDAFQACVDAIRPGAVAADVDAAARAVVAGSGFGGTQASRVAYSVGIAVPPDWGEGNILSIKPREERTLQANMTFHLLPWVQIPGKGGVGCTETIRVTETGCELLTDLPRELFVK
ncbi:MAG: Xaa-Pro peptidase family protein [Trueperaceae bacterium]